MDTSLAKDDDEKKYNRYRYSLHPGLLEVTKDGG
jgi:hypothetical protein